MQEFARADEGGFGRQRIDLGVAECERFESRRELAVQSRGRVRGIPVVGRDDGGIQLACLRNVAELLARPRRPVAPAWLVAQVIGHRRDCSCHFAPVTGPERSADVPLVGALVEVVLVRETEEFERARMTAPRQREGDGQGVRACSAPVESARLRQCRESGCGRLSVRAREA